MFRPALFLDRDGIVNIEKEYVYKKEDFQFQDGIFELCSYFKRKNYYLFIITNQAGIAKAKFFESDFLILNQWMIEVFKSKGITIDKVYYCPHHPDSKIEKYALTCGCRKPKPGMLKKAIKEFFVDVEHSILIGDKESDIEAGVNAGVNRNYLVKAHPKENYNKISKATEQFESISHLLVYFSI